MIGHDEDGEMEGSLPSIKNIEQSKTGKKHPSINVI